MLLRNIILMLFLKEVDFFSSPADWYIFCLHTTKHSFPFELSVTLIHHGTEKVIMKKLCMLKRIQEKKNKNLPSVFQHRACPFLCHTIPSLIVTSTTQDLGHWTTYWFQKCVKCYQATTANNFIPKTEALHTQKRLRGVIFLFLK